MATTMLPAYFRRLQPEKSISLHHHMNQLKCINSALNKFLPKIHSTRSALNIFLMLLHSFSSYMIDSKFIPQLLSFGHGTFVSVNYRCAQKAETVNWLLHHALSMLLTRLPGMNLSSMDLVKILFVKEI